MRNEHLKRHHHHQTPQQGIPQGFEGIFIGKIATQQKSNYRAYAAANHNQGQF